ncbi:MAG: S8 family serine peptidase [Bacteroidales bacterium]|nr:S8 family serine peptidase [Bacteroidales bacterium]
MGAQEKKPIIDPVLQMIYISKHPEQLNIKSARLEDTITNAINFSNKKLKEMYGIANEDDPIVSVFLDYEGNIDSLLNNNVSIGTRIGSLMTARFPLSKFEFISNLTGVKKIELGKPLHKFLDKSLGIIKADLAGLDFNKTGEGVVVGIIDDGVYHQHPTFSEDGSGTRIKHLWDMTSELCNTSPPINFDYGCAWNSSHVTGKQCLMQDGSNHGTGVAAIAAGNGRSEYATGATPFIGISPKADLVVVKILPANYVHDRITNTTTSVIDGLKFISDKAISLNKPWVANISVGSYFGPRDGSSLYERMVFDIVNQPSYGKGRIVVCAAGNNGYSATEKNYEDRIHSRGTASGEKTFVVNSSNETSEVRTEQMVIEIFFKESTSYSFSLISPNKTYGPLNPGEFYFGDNTDGFVFINYSNDDFIHEGLDKYIWINLHDIDEDYDGTIDYNLASGRWKLKFEGGSGTYDAYMQLNTTMKNNGQLNYFIDYDNNYLVSEPGNIQNVISVGSENSTKYEWNYGPCSSAGNSGQITKSLVSGDISYFSSPGPSRIGLTKPDIYAPGIYITTARSLNRTCGLMTTVEKEYIAANYPDYYTQSGTSFAAPHVTGAVALIMQALTDANEAITLDKVKAALFANKAKSTATPSLDIHSALQYIEDTYGDGDGNSTPVKNTRYGQSGIKLFPNPTTDFVTIQNKIAIDCEIEILNTAGKTLIGQHSSAKETVIDVKPLPAGIYIVKHFSTEGLAYAKFIKE